MSALPTPQPAYRYTHYMEELREFFADHHLYFGISTDIVPLVDRLAESDSFRDQMTSMVQLILAREGRSIPAAELLEIVANGIGGPLVHEPSPELNEPLSRLYDFLAAVPRPDDSGRAAEVLSFPRRAADENDPDANHESAARLGGARGEHAGQSAYDIAADDRPRGAAPGPSFRKMLIAGGIAVLVAVILALVLRPRTPAARPARVQAAGSSTVAHPPKPSAYGAAFTPTPPARRHSRRKPAADAAEPLGGGSASQPANAFH